jgi:hypothetical protein
MGSSRSKIFSRAESQQITDHGAEWQLASSAVQRHELGPKTEDLCKESIPNR